MRILRPIIAICTFALSLALTWILSVACHPTELIISSVETPDRTRRTYKITDSGKAITGDGHPASFTNYETSDGLYFLSWVEYYNSPRQVTKKLQERIKEAGIITRDIVLDEKGKRVGEKLIVDLAPDVSKRMNAALI